MYTIQEYEKDGYTISTDKTLLDIDSIYNYLSNNSYWAQGISRKVVEDSLANSLVFGLYCNSTQIGLARVITDKAVFAYLADVYILPLYRGKGLSKWMMDCIMAHFELQGLKKWMLATKDAHGLYAQFGFKPLEAPEKIMEKKLKN